jgi:hypothetical protein
MVYQVNTVSLPAHPKKPDRALYTGWILLTTVSVPIAYILDLVVLRIIIRYVGDFITVDGVRRITEDYLGVYVFVPIVGLLTGLLQYALLQRYLPRMSIWVLATLGGWLLGISVIAIPGRLGWTDVFLTNLDVAFLTMGLSIGLGQWLMLRQRLSRAGWWIAANILGWGLYGLVTPDGSIDLLLLAILGFLPACATAAALAFLFKQVRPGAEQAM